MPRRGGFTLVEIVVALALGLIVTGAIHRLLLTTQRLARAQAVRMDLQSSVRTSALVIANELRELNGGAPESPAQADLLSLTGNGLTYRAARGIGFLCQSPVAGQIRIARSSFSGYRDPQPSRDAAYLFVQGNPDLGTADAWLPNPITAVATAGTCPGTGEPAITISVSPAAPIAGAPVGTPLRIYEIMELRLYQSAGEWWMGARSVSTGEAIQPVSGPFAGSGGIRLEYLDRNGLSTTDPAAVKSVIATLRGTPEGPAFPPGVERLEEELMSQVTLRNGMPR